jgi:hypothetical protein
VNSLIAIGSAGIAALAPNYFWFGVAPVPVGLFAVTTMTSANNYVQNHN